MTAAAPRASEVSTRWDGTAYPLKSSRTIRISGSSDPPSVFREPLGELSLGQLAGRLDQGLQGRVNFADDEFAPVEVEKGGGDDKAGALVSVDKGMIAHDSEGVARGQFKKQRP